jgi:hypothetical protein
VGVNPILKLFYPGLSDPTPVILALPSPTALITKVIATKRLIIHDFQLLTPATRNEKGAIF